MRYSLLFLFLFSNCNILKQQTASTAISVYVWTRGFNNPPIEELKARFLTYKENGVTGVIYSAGKQVSRYEQIAKYAHEIGLEFQILLPAMIQYKDSQLADSLYVVNRLGKSAYDQPAYPRNHFLCPSREGVTKFLVEMYGKMLDIPYVDGIQLDVIRFPDVILAPALWEKYGVVMDKEYPKYDYCYCKRCVRDFQKKTGIDILAVGDPSQVEEWKQFRYDLITTLVNRLAKMAHQKGKIISAAVFPGPDSYAKKMVRQEWQQWEVDAFFPMNYNDFYQKGPAWLGDICAEEVAAVKGKIPIYSGLFICPNPANKTIQKDPEYFGLLPDELEEAMQASIDNGASGISLFTAGRMTAAHWAVYKEALSKIKKGQ